MFFSDRDEFLMPATMSRLYRLSMTICLKNKLVKCFGEKGRREIEEILRRQRGISMREQCPLAEQHIRNQKDQRD